MFFRAIIVFSLSKKYKIYITLYNQSIFRCTFYIYRYTCTYYIHGISHAHYECIVCVNTFTLYVRLSWPLKFSWKKGRGVFCDVILYTQIHSVNKGVLISNRIKFFNRTQYTNFKILIFTETLLPGADPGISKLGGAVPAR